MRVLFVQPDMVFKKHHPLVFKGFAATIPLGIAYMAAYLERAGHEVAVIDYQIGQYAIDKEIRRIKPDILGISICSPAVPHAFEIARIARKTAPEITIIAGGPHIMAYGEEVLKSCPQIDLLVMGEGELVLLQILERLSHHLSIDTVKGIIFRKGDESISTGPGPIIEDLAELPMLPLHLFQVEKYFPLPGTFRRLPSLAMSTSRGCPFHCTFCNSKTIWNDKVRIRPPVAVADEVEWVVRNYRAREIYFVDELFTVKRANVITFCEELLRRNLKVGWKCCARVDMVDRELLLLMKSSGCFMISYGVESGDDEILKIMKKGITISRVKETFRMTKEVGIARMAFFMLNSYGETRETIEKTLSLSKEIDPDFINFELFKPFPGIEMRKQIERDPNCTIREDLWNDWDQFTVGNQIFYVQNDLDEDYLREVYERSIKGFYLRPYFIIKSLINMKSIEQFRSYAMTFLNMLSVKVLTN